MMKWSKRAAAAILAGVMAVSMMPQVWAAEEENSLPEQETTAQQLVQTDVQPETRTAGDTGATGDTGTARNTGQAAAGAGCTAHGSQCVYVRLSKRQIWRQ